MKSTLRPSNTIPTQNCTLRPSNMVPPHTDATGKMSRAIPPMSKAMVMGSITQPLMTLRSRS